MTLTQEIQSMHGDIHTPVRLVDSISGSVSDSIRSLGAGAYVILLQEPLSRICYQEAQEVRAYLLKKTQTPLCVVQGTAVRSIYLLALGLAERFKCIQEMEKIYLEMVEKTLFEDRRESARLSRCHLPKRPAWDCPQPLSSCWTGASHLRKTRLHIPARGRCPDSVLEQIEIKPEKIQTPERTR